MHGGLRVPPGIGHHIPPPSVLVFTENQLPAKSIRFMCSNLWNQIAISSRENVMGGTSPPPWGEVRKAAAPSPHPPPRLLTQGRSYRHSYRRGKLLAGDATPPPTPRTDGKGGVRGFEILKFGAVGIETTKPSHTRPNSFAQRWATARLRRCSTV